MIATATGRCPTCGRRYIRRRSKVERLPIPLDFTSGQTLVHERCYRDAMAKVDALLAERRKLINLGRWDALADAARRAVSFEGVKVYEAGMFLRDHAYASEDARRLAAAEAAAWVQVG